MKMRDAMQGLPLDQWITVILDGSGNGQVSLGPGLPREHWQPASAFVSAATNVSEASCVISAGSTPTSATRIGQTSKGSSGATCSLNGDMPTGYRLWATWAGGDAGAQATMHVTGTRSFGSPS